MSMWNTLKCTFMQSYSCVAQEVVNTLTVSITPEKAGEYRARTIIVDNALQDTAAE